MSITTSVYLELPAPLDRVQMVLANPATWITLPLGADCSGGLWGCGGELYQLAFQMLESAEGDRPLTLRWDAAPVAAGPHLSIEIELYDATISTHLLVRVTLSGSLPRWLPSRRRIVRRIEETATRCTSSLAGQLREPEVLTDTLGAPTLAIPAPLTVSTGAVPYELRPPLLRSEPVESYARRESEPNPADPVRTLAERLRPRYPLTVASFEAMGALGQLARLHQLEEGWRRTSSGAFDPGCYIFDDTLPDTYDYDLIYAGGGLGLLHAAVMAVCYGYRVLLFDRGEVGCTHREWNISREELQALVATGVATWQELEEVVMREYRDGLVRFYAGPHNTATPDGQSAELRLPGVLNLALDSTALLRLMRRKLEEAGGRILNGRTFRRVRVSRTGPLRIAVELENLGTRRSHIEIYSARLLLDGMGTTSPLALLRHARRPFAGVCPTVGTVARGFAEGRDLREVDPTIGDILISVADAQTGEQMIWEGFPGRDDEMTVYLFYYATLESAHRRLPGGEHGTLSLLELFENYFKLLPTYKRPGPHFHHVKPVYGYIPSRHTLRLDEAPLLRGILPVGDSAAQQSPLTFCGFGSHVRNLKRTSSLLDFALSRELLDPVHLRHINAFQVNVSLNWVFSRFMHPWSSPDDVNRLQNVFLGVLKEMGPAVATRFFRDQMNWRDCSVILTILTIRFPQILLMAWRVLSPAGIIRWLGDYLRFTRAAAIATLARAAGPHTERLLTSLADRLSPRMALRIRVRYGEWRAMGWV